MIGINATETQDYISKHETDKEKPTIWKIGILDSILKSKIQDIQTVYETDPSDSKKVLARATVNLNERAIDIVRFGLKDMVNFIHPQTGKPIQFETVSVTRFGKNYNLVSDEILKVIPSKVLTELAEEISKQSGMTEEEVKN